MTQASTEGSAAPREEVQRESRRCAGKTARGLPCKLYVRNGLYCPYHGKTQIERWNASLAKELLRRRRERLVTWPQKKPFTQFGSMTLHPPVMPQPQNTRSAGTGAAASLFSPILNAVLHILARVFLGTWLAAALFVTMLAIGAVGIFVMVYIGAAVEMLSMAAY